MSKKTKAKLLKKPKQNKIKNSDFLSTGHTPLNLACSDRIDGALVKGIYHQLIGDSDTGKSVLGMSILAEAAENKHFKDYDLIYVNAEHSKLFHPGYKRIEVMEDINSPEALYYMLTDRMKNSPCVAIVDSMDALTPQAEDKKFAKRKKAYEEGKDAKGSYGLDKPKINAANLNKVCSLMDKNGSILVIISQTRDNIQTGPFAFGPKKTRSGGTAMKFYNRMEIWLSHPKQIHKEYKGKKVQIGAVSKVKVDKNHITGKKRSVMLTVYNDYGMDDIGDCIDFLIEWKHWKGTKKTVKAPEFDFNGKKAELIRKIENKDSRLRKIRKLVGKVWKEIENSVALKRRPRYEAY